MTRILATTHARPRAPDNRPRQVEGDISWNEVPLGPLGRVHARGVEK